MTDDWIDDPNTSFDDKIAHAEQFAEVEVSRSPYFVSGPANTGGSFVIQPPEMPSLSRSYAVHQNVDSSRSLVNS